MPWDICWGLVHSLGTVVIDNVSGFILSAPYICENVLPVCLREHEYKALDENAYIKRITKGKPLNVRSDDFIDNLYADISKDNAPRKTIKMV